MAYNIRKPKTSMDPTQCPPHALPKLLAELTITEFVPFPHSNSMAKP